MKETTVHSAGELLPHIKKQTLLPAHFYRGHAKISHKLVPSLFRFDITKTGFTDWNHLEATLRNEFDAKHWAFNAGSLSRIEQVCLARHHGLHVRVLDWSESAMVALFFAVEAEDNDGEDSIVWEFLPSRIMQGAPDDADKLSDLHVFLPKHSNQRVVAQGARFSWHNLPEGRSQFIALEDRKLANAELRRYIIPKNARSQIKQELNAMRINYQTLFPDLDGLCRQLNWMLSDQSHTTRRFTRRGSSWEES